MKTYRIDFGSVDENQNFNWDKIRGVMAPDDPMNIIDLSEIEYKKEEAEEVLEKIKPYIDESVVSILEVQG